MKNKLRKKRIACAVLSTALLTNAFHVSALANAASSYKDGTYTGTASGFLGDITVSVTVTDGAIAAIDVTEQKDTPSYWERAEAVIPEIITANGTEGVDAVSGATYSSEGIINAVNNALARSTAPDCFADGSGSANDPFVVKTAAQLAGFAESVDSGENYLGKYIVLDADIDLSDIANWNPIGAEGAASKNLDKIFAGDFNGRGHIIKGLNIKANDETAYTDETNVGLFSTLLSTAKVSGIRLENVDINVAGTKVVRAGGITGDITSKAVSKTDGHAVIDSCSVSGSVSAKTNEAMVMTGGVVGRAAGNATISNCVSETSIYSASNTKIAYGAGIVSMSGNDTYIVNCANTGDIKVLTSSGLSLYAGGVAGMMTSEQYNCFSAGNVTVGTIAQSDASNCAGIINGALMPAASGKYDYYADSAELRYIDESGAETSVGAVSDGAGSMNAEGTFAAEKVAEINSSEFADKLNENLYDISKILANENNTAELRLWKLSDEGKITLSDEVFINDVIDASIFESGKGTAEEPYMLKTADQLRAFASSLSEHIDYSGVFIELMSDIDVSDKEWTPIGNSDYVFNGSFDGKGHTVSGMTVGSAEKAMELVQDKNYIGFFSVLGTNAVVKNVKLTNVLINATYNASAYAGGIAAFMNSDSEDYKGAVIDSCEVNGSIKLTSDKGNNFVGGIAAYVYKGVIINCKTDVDAYCTVTKGSAFGETGGLAALVNRGLVANSYSLGNVYGSGNREDEGMAVISSLVAVNAGYLVNCYGAGQHETNDYSIYTGAVSGWITGIGHTYDCYYNGEASMKIGEKTVDPVAAVGTRVSSGVSDEGMAYTGGVVYNNEAYTSKDHSKLAEKLNENFNEFPVELTQFGLTKSSLKTWKYDSEVTFADEYAEASYVQPEAEIVKKEEAKLNDGTWYGRDKDKKAVVTITVENGEVTKIISSDGSTSGEVYDEALQTAKDKSTYNDKTTYAAADASKFAGGMGTEEEPYLIRTEAQLRYVAEAMNDDVDWKGIWFALDSDITLTGDEWLPIGHAIQAEIDGQKETVSVYPFRGSFDGRNHTISGLAIGSKEAPADIYLSGLFGLAAGEHDTNLTPEADEELVTIKNIKLKDISINVDSRYEANVGGLIAWAQNGFVIDNCSVEGTINAKTRESFARIGGLAGSTLRGTITDCCTNVEINAATGTSSVYAGGLAGMTNRSAQVNCYTLGNITANAESNNKAMVGGFTGMSGGTNISCYTYGNVESLITTVDVGGINGRNAGISLDYECCYNGSAVYKAAGKEITEKTASGTVVGGELKTSSKTAAEMASDEFVKALNANKENMPKILEDVSAYLDDMMSNNKEGLSHLLFYTNDGTDLNSWSKGDKAPVFASENYVEADDKDNIASDEELCSWAVNDYQSKNKVTDASASIKRTSDGDREISITDSKGNVLDKYTVDPETGKGVNSANEPVNLPQTGNNSMYRLFIILGAFMMIGLGMICIKGSMKVRRREE
ncbi:FMN-binding protein [Ruminococcus sp.]|uniref:FMN-binding protein n=1 Tax=Ruminococcus sp. TaxID=41978 RepID=UPI0025D09C7F|nr:FMN-binding protein [Ruminococcus sp.]MCR4640221.1 FMN-binding protein [Ruminococcus sp.]